MANLTEQPLLDAASCSRTIGGRGFREGFMRDPQNPFLALGVFMFAARQLWAASERVAERRDPVLEAKVLATKLIVMAELRRVRDHSKRLRRWYYDTEEARLELIDAATGGCFQQETGPPTPNGC